MMTKGLFASGGVVAVVVVVVGRPAFFLGLEVTVFQGVGRVWSAFVGSGCAVFFKAGWASAGVCDVVDICHDAVGAFEVVGA
jgi:hypothetical protein